MKKKITYLVSGIVPKIFVNFAFKKLTTPQVFKLRSHEMEVLHKAEKSIFQFNSFEIQLYEWKAGPEKVFLIHGWEGQAANFADLVEKFLERNITVIAFDGPAHGFSSKAVSGTSLFEFAILVGVLIEKFAVKNLVSHSFGGVATTYALSKNTNLVIDKYVLFASPNRFVDRIEVVAKNHGLHNRVTEKLYQKLEKKLNLDPSHLNVEDFVQGVQVKEALILHDTYDKVLSVEESRAVAKKWSSAKLIEVTKTGHFRILRTPEVLDMAVNFMEFEKKV
jgi:pimeloyl-ACP methyl ester carboxylesterase